VTDINGGGCLMSRSPTRRLYKQSL